MTLARLLLGAGIVSHLALLFQVFHPKWLTVMAWVLPAVVVLPWVFLGLCSRLARGRRTASRVVLGVSALYLVLGVWAYWDTIYIHPDPQGGLVFFVMPVLGGLAAALLMVGLLLSRPQPTSPR
ncbi:MAG: hypothetical protein AUJ20_12130 [Comamonadaceae bacterium CG1_02_60_18]|nr:MAG: hypothetical protein AUJ20_12130 [Comamonadaceae bacterium CG1_02_60_18]PIQ51480.1 MAG: hypothetical protein COW02_14725 [Comamonadaceae bacterium CG12_big_fil_rev_8_21_14_0_65_59_15]